MKEETKYTNKFQPENQPEHDDRLPYEPPMLRKHGKVNNATQTVPDSGFVDSFFGPGFGDDDGGSVTS